MKTGYKYGKLFKTVSELYAQEFKQRYAYVRKEIINCANIQYLLSNFLVDVPSALIELDVKKYPSIPGSHTNNIAQIVGYMNERLKMADEIVDSLI